MGKLLVAQATSTTPNVLFNMHPLAFGARAAAMAAIFTSFKIKRIVFRVFVNSAQVSNQATVLGILDDATSTEGDAPTTAAGVLELRCSRVQYSGQTLPSEFEFTPVDKNLWYKCSTATSVTDPRLVYPGILYAAVDTGVGFVSIEANYHLVFKGASDTGTL
jgi:hypothetical protein